MIRPRPPLEAFRADAGPFRPTADQGLIAFGDGSYRNTAFDRWPCVPLRLTYTATEPGEPNPPSGSRAQSPARRSRCSPGSARLNDEGEVMAVETITTNLVFTGPLTWSDEAACRGEARLFFAPAGLRPDARPRRGGGDRPVAQWADRRRQAVPELEPGAHALGVGPAPAAARPRAAHRARHEARVHRAQRPYP